MPLSRVPALNKCRAALFQGFELETTRSARSTAATCARLCPSPLNGGLGGLFTPCSSKKEL